MKYAIKLLLLSAGIAACILPECQAQEESPKPTNTSESAAGVEQSQGDAQETLVAATPAQSKPEPVDLGGAAPSFSETDNQLEVPPGTTLQAAIQLIATSAGIPSVLFESSVASYVTTNSTISRISHKNVDPEEFLTEFLDTWKLGMSRKTTNSPAKIFLKTKDESLIPVIFKLKYGNVTNIASVVTASLPPGRKVFPDIRTGRIIVLASEADLVQVTNLISKLDVTMKQVLIEARFIETLKNPKSVKGVDWTGTLQGQRVTFGNGLTTSGTTTTTTPGDSSSVTLPSGRQVQSSSGSTVNSQVTSTLSAGGADSLLGLTANTARGFSPATAFLNADGVSAVLSFLNTDADTESLALPRTVTLEGNRAEFSVVRNIPVFEEQQGQLTGGGGQQPPTVKPNYNLTGGQTNSVLNEVGIKLFVTPRILADTNVFLELQPEISIVEALAERKILGGKQNEAPIFARRSLTTQAIVPSGNTLILGGLMQDDSSKSFTKVPVLGDIPLLGLAFRKDSKERSKRNLMIFVTPTIVGEDDFNPTDSGHDYLRQKPSERVAPDPTAWDSGSPKEWGKPKR